MSREGLEALPEECAIVSSALEAEMGYGVDEGLGIPDRSLLY
jgi:hypothetical protein